MRMSRAGEYAIRCMFYLAKQGCGVVANRKAVATEMDIPDQFLGKIAQQLAKAGLIEIVQGPKGGFRLTRTPDNISMLDVIEAVIGPIFLNDCVLRPDSCHRSPFCSVHTVWQQVCGQLKAGLQDVRFSELVRDEALLLGK
uniref:Rrf2 family transcriptional regulator n=1 Tax=Desulfatirhabdium butyrativorans TaxID=340467 RepID=A0A7C4RN79_9BACT